MVTLCAVVVQAVHLIPHFRWIRIEDRKCEKHKMPTVVPSFFRTALQKMQRIIPFFYYKIVT